MTTDILHKVPNPPFEVEIMDKAPVEVTNPFSKQKVMLEQSRSRCTIASRGQRCWGNTTRSRRDWTGSRNTIPKSTGFC